MHKIIVIIDDAFGCGTYLALCQLVNFKGFNGFSIGNVLENFKASYFSHIVAHFLYGILRVLW